MVAASKLASRRDVPDILGFQDYAADHDGTASLVAKRIADEAVFLDWKQFPLPKPNGGTRSLAVINPIDEFTLRTFVGRCSSAISAATYNDRVFNGLIRRPGPSWFSADFREQSRRRRELQRSLYEEDSTVGVGFFDVKDFFKSCRHDHLVDLLLAARAPRGAVHQLAHLLGTLYPSKVGLPVGFEGSGPMANLFLDSVDRGLLEHGIEFVRWTDDLDVFLQDLDQWQEVYELTRSRLEKVGLRLNESKVDVLEKGPAAEHRLLDPGRDSIFEGDALENIATKLDVELWMRQRGSLEEMPPAHLRSCLGLLRSKASSEAVKYLMQTPDWVDREPRSVGDYLAALASNPAVRNNIDPHWLVDLAIGREPTAATVAGQLHMCRVLTEFGPDKDAGNRMLDFAYSPIVLREYPALGGWAVRAWSASRGWKPSASTDLVQSIGHLSYRRAAIAGFAGHSSASDHARLGALARNMPEVGPVVRFALAA